MSVVRFDQIARECRETFKSSFEGKPIVGLEHIAPYDMLLKNYDVDVETTFTKSFKKGQILFGRRRAYQHKACVATIDGICSGDITVIEPIEGKVYPDLLPFIIQNDNFFEHAIKGSNGALSPRVKWEHMANFEFNLPSLAEQKVLAEKLWAAYEVKQSYLKMIAATEEMVKSQFIEMFDFKDKGLYRTWGELFETQLGKMLDKNKQNPKDTSCQYLANINVQWGFFDMTNLNFMTFKENELLKFELKPNDLLICEGGDAGRCAVWKEGDSKIKYQKAIHRARPIDGTIIDVNYVQYYIQYYKKCGKLYDFITKGTIEHLTGEKLNEVPVFVPPMDQQHQFVLFAQQADKSISELRKSVDAIDKVIKSLINENL